MKKNIPKVSGYNREALAEARFLLERLSHRDLVGHLREVNVMAKLVKEHTQLYPKDGEKCCEIMGLLMKAQEPGK